MTDTGGRIEEHYEPDSIDAATKAMEAGGLGRLLTPRTVIFLVLGIVAAILGLYVLLPKLVGVQDAINRIGDARTEWILVAFGFLLVALASYGAVFRAVVGAGDDPRMRRRLSLRHSYKITMAGFAGTTLFSAGGAGGLVVVYWALRKAGMEARRAACRMVALLVVLYSFYALSVIVFGILLRTGVLPGAAPAAGTIVPAAIAGVLIVLAALIALIPGDFERRIKVVQRTGRRARIARRLAPIPGTLATGVRTALDRLRDPHTAWLAVGGGICYWAGNIGILWAAFHAFGVHVPLGVVVQGFFVGMAANVIPSPAAGAGPVDAGMIAAFLLFDIPKESVFPAVLTYRLIAFWSPVIPGVLAYFRLRKTVRRWEEEDAGGYALESKVLEAR
jgi:uncharacterized protein (TIRG00374 family)